MINSMIITNLFNKKEPLFLQAVFEKHCEYFLNLAMHIKNKNFSSIPYERNDFQMVLKKSIDLMSNVTKECIEKFTYKVILRKIFVQRIIALQREAFSNKNKILSSYCNVSDIEQLNNKDIENDISLSIHQNMDACKFYFDVLHKIKSKVSQKIFQLYLINWKPQEIAKHINKSSKFVSNVIFRIKQIYKTIDRNSI